MLEDLVALEETRARMVCDEESTNLAVFADYDRLSAVFGHLFENATEAIDKDGWVRVHLYQRDRSAVVEFVDNGCGMDAAFIDRELFRPFRSTKTGGFGLGAYQCREYVREVGGDVEIISSSGSGTTVRVILPAAGVWAGEDKSQAATELA
jgi:signal transduction histidine kinase